MTWKKVRLARNPCAYILASRARGTLYIGLTADLVRRVWQHRRAQGSGFTHRYRVHELVWYEAHETIESAISRETSLKAWRRLWKIRLIDATNPQWRDLYPDIL
ncbi:GIY-YIG nuclease family protein [Lysobacter changpingensis]|uniref:GIY-YIG nuclease family protein n=1 Tax=Lysobacter changpingensis TaxID=2792784 RepID=UPI001A8F71AA|nr:GIY-YIG nuclease family protein [Lysobacter changpingensis]